MNVMKEINTKKDDTMVSGRHYGKGGVKQNLYTKIPST